MLHNIWGLGPIATIVIIVAMVAFGTFLGTRDALNSKIDKKPLKEIARQLAERAFEALNASVGGGQYVLDVQGGPEYKIFRKKRWTGRTGKSYKMDVVVRVGIIDSNRKSLVKNVDYVVSFAASVEESVPLELHFYPLDIRRRASSNFAGLERAYSALVRSGVYHFRVADGNGILVSVCAIV